MYDKDIKEGMSRGHSMSARANYSGSTPQGDKFASSGGFKITKDAGMGYSYGTNKVASSPMMSPQQAQKSWRSTGSYSRSSRNESPSVSATRRSYS